MAGAREAQLTGSRVEHRVQRGREDIASRAIVVGVDEPQDLGGRVVLERVGAHRGAHAAHHRCRIDALTGYISDRDAEAVAPELEHLVPIATDRKRVRRRPVADGDRVPRNDGNGHRQHAPLERACRVANLGI